MNLKNILTVMSIATLLASQSCCNQQTSGINYDYMNTEVAPGDDFSEYATGHWIDYNPRNPEYSRWGSFMSLRDQNQQQLKELIDDLTSRKHAAGTVDQKVADLYLLGVDSTRLNNEGAAPLKPYLAEIEAIATREELTKYLTDHHDNLLWSLGITTDEANASDHIVYLGQGGMSLGDESYYLNPAKKNILDAYVTLGEKLFVLCGYTPEVAAAKMASVLKIETEMAKVAVSRVDLRVPENNYHKMTVAEVSELTKYDWDAYLKAFSYTETTELDLAQIKPVQRACELMKTASLEDLKNVYLYQTIRGAAGCLSDDFYAETKKFSDVLMGATAPTPRWKRSLGRVDGLLGEPLGQMYVKKFFPESSKQRMLTLVSDLQASLGERIQDQAWMCEETKEKALEKLATFTVKIGYPDKWEDVSGLTVDPSKSLYENVRQISEYYFAKDIEKNYNKPVDPTEWFMTPQTVNAYYNPTTNEICFPAGILQPPFFSGNADDAANYGAIGVVIGHEMTHGFDDQGRKFDKEGNMNEWWQPSDVEGFNAVAQQLVEHFNNLDVIPAREDRPEPLKANGQLSLGENLADHGGLTIAFNAFQRALERHPLGDDHGFTPEQRFFLAYANVWASDKESDAILEYLTTMDVHSVSRLRINGTLPHIDAWYEAFGVKEGDALYIAPENRVKIW